MDAMLADVDVDLPVWFRTMHCYMQGQPWQGPYKDWQTDTGYEECRLWNARTRPQSGESVMYRFYHILHSTDVDVIADLYVCEDLMLLYLGSLSRVRIDQLHHGKVNSCKSFTITDSRSSLDAQPTCSLYQIKTSSCESTINQTKSYFNNPTSKIEDVKVFIQYF